MCPDDAVTSEPYRLAPPHADLLMCRLGVLNTEAVTTALLQHKSVFPFSFFLSFFFFPLFFFKDYSSFTVHYVLSLDIKSIEPKSVLANV